METLIKWLIGDMGTRGEYMYGSMHLTAITVVFAVLVLSALIVYINRSHPNRTRALIVAVSIFQLAFEVIWRLIYLFVKGDSILSWWPLYPCNLNGILIPLIAILNWKPGKKLFYLFGFIGGLLTFAMPDGIFCTDVFVFPILKSVLQHTGLLLIPVMELVCGRYRPTFKDLGWVLTGCLIHLANCEGIDRLLGFTGDYMFLRSELPFVIPNVPQYITLSVFAILVLALLSFLCDIKGSMVFFRSLRKQKNPSGTAKN